MANLFSNIANIGSLMQQAKGMQQKLKQVQDELAETHLTGESGAGMVQLTINGRGEALHINIEEAVYQEDKKILQGLIVAAINDANHKRENKKKEVMGGLMTSMGLPPGTDLDI
jgi:DNA-binding YbaB/EbfC family protein